MLPTRKQQFEKSSLNRNVAHPTPIACKGLNLAFGMVQRLTLPSFDDVICLLMDSRLIISLYYSDSGQYLTILGPNSYFRKEKKPSKLQTMRANLLLLLLCAFLACKASAFLSVREKQRMQTFSSRLGLHPHLGVMGDIAAVYPTFPDLNPEVRVEMVTDVSHVALDLTAFLTPSRLHILSFAILGRMLVIYNDCCLLGPSVPREELAVQAFLLAVNLKDLANALVEKRS